MTDIDYKALAKEDYRAWYAVETVLPIVRAENAARAVVAAYQEQMRARGVVEVRADDLGWLRYSGAPYMSQFKPDELARIDAALAAPEPVAKWMYCPECEGEDVGACAYCDGMGVVAAPENSDG